MGILNNISSTCDFPKTTGLENTPNDQK